MSSVIRKAELKDFGACVEIYNYYIENTTVTFEETPLTVEEFEARFIFPPPFAPQKPMRRTKIDRKRFLKTERLKRRKNLGRTFAFSKSLRDKRPENRRSAYFPILSKTICQANPTKYSKAFSLRLSAAFFMRQRRPRFPFSSGHPTSADVRSRIFESFSPFQESRKEEF